MKKVWKILAAACLIFAAAVFVGTPAEAASKTINNGGSVVQSGGYIYYLANESDSSASRYKLRRIKVNNKKRKNLDAWKGVSGSVYVSGKRIFYQRGTKIYSNPLNKKAKKKIATGTLVGVYGSKVYYIKGKSNSYKLHVIGTNGKNDKTLTKAYKSLSFAGVSGKHLILNAKRSRTANDILYVNMSKKKVKILTTEHKVDGYLQVAKDIVISGKTLYYACGSLQGSGSVFAGDLKKIRLSGKDKETIAERIGSGSTLTGTKALIHSTGGYIYFCQDGTPMRVKLSTGKVSKAPGEQFLDAAGKYAYYMNDKKGKSKATVYRYELSKGSKKAKKFITVEKKSSNTVYSISDVVQIGGYVYLDFDVREFSEEYGWEGNYLGTDNYKVKVSGKKLKKLN